MMTSKQKCDLLNSIYSSLKDDAPNAQRQMRDYLLRDTIDAKLYKYRVVNNKNLECLKDGTMYCAFPSSFNDPFDFKMGYSLKDLYEAKHNAALKWFEALLLKYFSVLAGKLSACDCSESEWPVIEAWLRNERLSGFLKSLTSTAEKQPKRICIDDFVLTDLLYPLVEYGNFVPYMESIKLLIPRVVESIQSNGAIMLSGECFSIDDFAAANGITADTDEVEKTILLSKKLDPQKEKELESARKTLKSAEVQFDKDMLNLFRIGSLATDCKNRLMWSHYANAHKGFCIEYDFSATDTFTMERLPFPVVYSTQRGQIPWKAVIENTPESMAEGMKTIMFGLLTKDKVWEYENEWRIMIPGKMDPFLKMPPITCVYLGAAINLPNKRRILKIARDKGIPVKQMTVDRGAYELHARDVEE